jgi:protein SCO1/2
MMRFSFLVALVAVCAALTVGAAERMPNARENSLYALQISFEDQDGRPQTLDVYRGHPVIVTMFYASCPAACPLLIESIRATENALKPEDRKAVRVLLISIDPQRDTPAALAALAKTRHVDTSRWKIVRAKEHDVRTIAAVLGVQYRLLPNGEFNHTSALTVLSRGGEIGAQTTKLGKPDPTFVSAISAAVAQGKPR